MPEKWTTGAVAGTAASKFTHTRAQKHTQWESLPTQSSRLNSLLHSQLLFNFIKFSSIPFTMIIQVYFTLTVCFSLFNTAFLRNVIFWWKCVYWGLEKLKGTEKRVWVLYKTTLQFCLFLKVNILRWWRQYSTES